MMSGSAARESAERETREVIADLRRKLAEAGVEGSPPLTGDTTIGALLERARTAERRVEMLREAHEQVRRDMRVTTDPDSARWRQGIGHAASVIGNALNATDAEVRAWKEKQK